MTVLESIRRNTEYLTDQGVQSPRLQVELMLAQLLHVARLDLYLNFERVLSARELDSLRQWIERRSRREPLQHILGTACFCGLDFAVNSQVLVPRPETELLAERAWQRLNQTEPASFGRRICLDFGVGSGNLAVTIAAHCPPAQIHAVDISDAALTMARLNAARHGVQDRICFYSGDGFKAVPEGVQYDLIVSNPPYIATEVIEKLQPEVRCFDPHLALDGGPDGLLFFRRLAREAHRFLLPAARMMLEFGDDQEEALKILFNTPPWRVQAIQEDLSGRPRIMEIRLL